MAENSPREMGSKTKLKKGTPEKATALKVSLEKKKECEANALLVVGLLLDNTMTAEELLVKCLEINKLYYRDVVEERAIVHLCGYPACNNKLKKMASSQQYHISLRFNKVFDITERNRFCSNLCFKASLYLENQLPTCPIWLLEDERPQDLKLFQQQEKILGLGKEVILEDFSIKDELIKSKTEFVISTDELSKQLKEIKIKDGIKAPKKTKSSENNSCISVQPSVAQREPLKTKAADHVKEMPVRRLEVIEQSLKQWMTLATLQFLLGPQKFRTELTSNGLNMDEVEELTEGQEYHEKIPAKKYMELCHKIDLEAIADNALDSKLVKEDQEDDTKKEMPSYECLTKEAKRFGLNVQAYYQGRMELLKEDANVEDDATSPKAGSATDIPEGGPQYVCHPLVDNRNQRALRRRIVFDKLNRVCRTVLKMLELSPRDISVELRELVATFDLQAHNITFKPTEWTLVIFIILHLLALKMTAIRQKLQQESSQRCLAALLQVFNKPVDYLTYLVDLLTDVKNVFKS